MWRKILSQFIGSAPSIDSIALRYQAAHDDLDPEIFTLKGAIQSLQNENFESDGMGNYFCEIKYTCRIDRKPMIFKITQQEYDALDR